MKFYKAHLTRRLILDASADNDKEEMMVNWLREVGMPADFVNKLSRMFQDLKVSEDFNRAFREQAKEDAAEPCAPFLASLRWLCAVLRGTFLPGPLSLVAGIGSGSAHMDIARLRGRAHAKTGPRASPGAPRGLPGLARPFVRARMPVG